MDRKNGDQSRRLGEILTQQDYITSDQLEQSLRYQKETGAKIGESLLAVGAITDSQLAVALARQRGLQIINLAEVYPNPAAVSLLTEKFIRTRQVLPIDFQGNCLVLAMVNPLDVVTVDDVRMIAGHEVMPHVAAAGEFADAIEYVFSRKGRLGGTDEGEESANRQAEEQALAQDFSVISLVDEILDTALKRRASDVHFEPQAEGLIVRVRVDGVLHHLTTIPSARAGGVISRMKIIGDMDIAERRLPLDGRATYSSENGTVDLRIASLPTVFGENVTVRLLDSSSFTISLENLGMGEKDLDIFRKAVSRPHGQILITGPTGSGKSTSLYAVLEELNKPTVKIYTVEDPVERKMPGILQTQIKSSIGLTFATSLRSLVRSDPDIIMIGEIRDYETALIATEASLTGHLVLSTLHTNDAPTTVSRLLEMGIPAYLIASSLECVVAQRLARRLCPHCAERVTLTPSSMTATEREFLGKTKRVEVSQPTGCRRCFNTGYIGRVGLFEVLKVGSEIRRLILDHATADKVREVARGLGMRTLRHDGLGKVLGHVTSVEEVMRVTA